MAGQDITQRLFSLDGKVAIVTGGSRGIGRMIAQGLVAAGVRTYITARKAEDCLATAEELSRTGPCIGIPGDLSDSDQLARFAEDFGQREAGLDILVNNAGAAWGAPFDDYPEAGWDKVFDINLRAMFFLTQRLMPMLEARGSAEDPSRIINIASVNGISHPHSPNYAYSASKAGVIQLTRHLAAEFAPRGVNVNAIAPGYFPSKMTAHIGDRLEGVLNAIPHHRAGAPDDAAGLAIFLSSRASAYITGVTIPMDGGLIAAA
jgi:NAD(P)-dependent dehydrogenase (short-subunit alcohol dehydrogenase family)